MAFGVGPHLEGLWSSEGESQGWGTPLVPQHCRPRQLGLVMRPYLKTEIKLSSCGQFLLKELGQPETIPELSCFCF